MNQLAPEQTAHPAVVAQEFMRRAELKGGEVEAYAQTFNWLQSIAAEKILTLPADAQDALLDELKELREFKRQHTEDEDRAQAEADGDLPVLEPEDTEESLEEVDSEVSE